MFVRYRKLLSDSREPHGVQSKLACSGECIKRERWTGANGGPVQLIRHCPVKPRCRWRIGLDAKAGLDLALTPYRLHVWLAENRREAGRVRQEHVADLGAVAVYLLPEFWDGLDPALVARIKADNWDLRSVEARMVFWNGAKPRLDRLSNRLDPKAIRMAIHRRIPWPKQAERELAEARENFRSWKSVYDIHAVEIERNEQRIKSLTEKNAELREKASEPARAAAQAAERLAKLAP
jgi:hypothetical protein